MGPLQPAAPATHLSDAGFAGALLGTPERRLFASRDLDEVRAQVGRVMKPHGLDIIGRAQQLDASMHHAAFGRVALSRLRYGAGVEIRPGPLDDFYLVQMPLAGSAEIASGRQRIESTPELASVLSPAAPTTMRWLAGNDQIMVRIARPLVDAAAAARHGRALPGAQPLEFELGFRWRDSAAWRCLVAYLLECSVQGIDFTHYPLLAGQIEQLVVATLMSVHPHRPIGLRAASGRVLPRHVRRVQEHLWAHVDEPVSPAELATLAGVSLRSLYAGFRDFCGTSPMHYLRDLRLDRARADLQAGDGAAPVAAVAMRWGFGHLGRFSADYKSRFGESPSQTLRRH